MEETIEVGVTPQQVWEMWGKAHVLHGQKGIEAGQTGKYQFRYQILDVKEGESFSILWKTLFVRLVFSHSVKPAQKGAQICYAVSVKGLFAWPVHWLLRKKLKANMAAVLQAMARQLENQREKQAQRGGAAQRVSGKETG
jgi:hypothetical protein